MVNNLRSWKFFEVDSCRLVDMFGSEVALVSNAWAQKHYYHNELRNGTFSGGNPSVGGSPKRCRGNRTLLVVK